MEPSPTHNRTLLVELLTSRAVFLIVFDAIRPRMRVGKFTHPGIQAITSMIQPKGSNMFLAFFLDPILIYRLCVHE